MDWEQKFPLTTVQALTRTGSDHSPLLVDFGEQAHLGNKAFFSFELEWFNEDGFYELILREWNASLDGLVTVVEFTTNKKKNCC